MTMRRAAAIAFCLLAAACGQPAERAEAAGVSPPAEGTQGGFGEGMVAAANPMAVEAGLEILRAGGSAADAAVAVQAVLSLVEPQSSGLGGGAFMIYRDAETGDVTAYDGRETAPASAGPELFFDDNGEVLGFLEAWTSGRAAGAPGAVAMLGLAQADHGRLDWGELFDSPIALAEDGFAVPQRMSQAIAGVARFGALSDHAATRAYFFTETGAPLPAGSMRTNPAYAETLRMLAEGGPEAFYEGPIAEAIVAAVHEAPIPGELTLADLAAYEAERNPAVCRPYRVWLVCSAPPPSSGGVIINQALGLLEARDMGQTGPDGAEGWHYLIDALRLAYADRDLYVADPDFADVPVDGLLDDAYLAERAALIAPDRAIETARAGTPPGAPARGADATQEVPGTSHFVVVDRWGDVASVTTSVEATLGSQRMAGGFILNNQLTDFARQAYGPDGAPLANAPAGGKRPRSSMSPVIVLDAETGDFVLAVGSPGGNSIPSYVVKALVAMLDWGLEPQAAVALPNVVARGDRTRVEQGFPADVLAELRAMGHQIADPQGENSGLHAVRLTPEGLEGGADPRREGQARAP